MCHIHDFPHYGLEAIGEENNGCYGISKGVRGYPRWCSPSEWGKESNSERAIAFAREMEVYESIATLYFHSSRVCSGIGYRNMGTLGVTATSQYVPNIVHPHR
jgi:hypothetical protein